jgi:serine/threonine-protein kinase
MAMMFGRFDIQGEIASSDTALVYKATDTQTNQTVALKTQNLAPLGERTTAFVEALLAEGESARDLTGQNIAPLYGAGESEGQFCAAMEYIQGNSIATMLARKEGFSIWDLVDITRQMCAGLETAASRGVVHYSLEPAKIMVQWDGLVKILGYGVSRMSLIQAEMGHGLGHLLPYCSPEQVRGEGLDGRSNLFTWGAILYEMVTGRKAFDATDPEALAAQIQNEMPPNPCSLNQRIQPGVGDLIMKALSKDPELRYQTARALVADLEVCKDGGKKAAPAVKKPSAASSVTVSPEVRNAAASKFLSPTSSRPAETAPSFSSAAPEPEIQKFTVAAAGAGAMGAGRSSSVTSGARMIEPPEHATPDAQSAVAPDPMMSAATAESETETRASRVAVDPMMAGAATAAAPAKSFSDLDELPPLKEVAYTPPPPPPPVADVVEPRVVYPRPEQKPKVQPREVAQKAAREIRTIPPQLMMYSILGAVGLILVVCVIMFLHVRSEDDGSTAAPKPVEAAANSEPTSAPAPAAGAPQSVPVVSPEPESTPEPEVTVRQIGRKAQKAVKRPVTPSVIPGQIQVDSNPQGAQIQIDGKSDPSWVTPMSLTGMAPGKHVVAASKAGYTAEVRSVDVAAASKSFVVLQLSTSNATVVVNSNPAGAEIVLDGRSTGKVTPAQFTVEKGSHTVAVHKTGYLEETTSTTLASGQNFQFGPALRPLGNADDIRSVGKFKKLFGKGGDGTAEMGSVNIRTQPKGAQIAINQHLVEKISPTEFMVGPGNYVLDITLTGYKPVHTIITVERGGKVTVDETLQRE